MMANKVPMMKGVSKGVMFWDHEVKNMEKAGWEVDEDAVKKQKAEATAKAKAEKEAKAKAEAAAKAN